MLVNRSRFLTHNLPSRNYGIAITDVDGDGENEIFVAGFGHPNRVYKWVGNAYIDIADYQLTDEFRMSIGVAAGDIDGDGLEEIYVLNSDTFGGRKRFGDRLLDFDGEDWIDLFALPMHRHVLNLTAGRSVIAVDRKGEGVYGFFVANYGGTLRLYELNPDGQLADVAAEAGLDLVAGGRSAIAVPFSTQHTDIFTLNENGENFFFRNQGDGTFVEMAEGVGVSDPYHHGRGIAPFDSGNEKDFGIVYGNWEGPHRLLMPANGKFVDVAPPEMALPSKARGVIVADFDNDGYEEIFFNNIGEPNRLFAQLTSGMWASVDIGDALEPTGLGTGAAVGDFDDDGRLELIIAHGESGLQPLSLYKVEPNPNAWLRVAPKTPYGAPARGAIVKLSAGKRTQIRVIDSGSGYLCQMEPVAHFGLGTIQEIDAVTVHWSDGQSVTIESPMPRQTLVVEHPQTLRF